jgi:acyl carrier protein
MAIACAFAQERGPPTVAFPGIANLTAEKDNPMQSASIPSTNTESVILKIWIEVLRNEQIGLDDNFVDLNGSSMEAMLCISRLQKAFGVDFTVEDFLIGTPSVREFARMAEEQITAAKAPGVPN